MPFRVTWMDLEIGILGEVSKKEKFSSVQSLSRVQHFATP